MSQILASFTKILRLSDFQNVSVPCYLIVHMRSSKATPSALAHICKQSLIHPVPAPSHLPCGLLLIHPPAPPLQPRISRGPPTPSLLSRLPARGSAFGVPRGRQQPPHPLLGCTAQQLCRWRSGGFPGGGSCLQGLQGRGRAGAEPPQPWQEGMEDLRTRRTAGRFLPGRQERREGPTTCRCEDLPSHPARNGDKCVNCKVSKTGWGWGGREGKRKLRFILASRRGKYVTTCATCCLTALPQKWWLTQVWKAFCCRPCFGYSPELLVTVACYHLCLLATCLSPKAFTMLSLRLPCSPPSVLSVTLLSFFIFVKAQGALPPPLPAASCPLACTLPGKQKFAKSCQLSATLSPTPTAVNPIGK